MMLGFVTYFYLYFFALSQNIYSIEIKDHSHGQVNSSVYSLCRAEHVVYCTVCSVHEPKIDLNWYNSID